MDINTELARMDYFLGILQRARKEGLLCLEEIIQDMEKQEDFDFFDLTYIGFRLVVEGWASEDIERIFDNYRTQSLDTLTFRIITQSCLAIQRGDRCAGTILYYAALLPKEIRKSDPFLSLAKKYGYKLKYETWKDHEAWLKGETESSEK